jgi:RNA polymerase sigma factor (sigma-70 family)
MTFETYYNENFQRFVDYLARLLKGEVEEAEDRVQNIFLGIMSKPGKWEQLSVRPFDPDRYMTRAVINQAAQYIRDKRMSLPLYDDYLVTKKTPLEILLEDDEHQLLRGFVSKLEPLERNIVVLRFYAGQNFRRMAAYLGIPLSTCKYHYDKAIKTLQEFFDEEKV